MARLRAAVLLAIVGGSLPPRTSGQEQNLPHWPRQFSASLEVTTKHLNKTNVYPPAWRTIDVVYDFINKRAGAYVQTSYEKRQKTNGTTTLRRYDLGKEWEISQFGKEMVCKWSRILNAKMPRPDFFDPDREVMSEVVTREVKGKRMKCTHWSQKEEGGSTMHFYETVGSRLPVLLENDDMIYEFKKFNRKGKAAKASSYELPKEWQPKSGACERVPQDVGFPYIHLLHTYVRF